MPHQSNHPEVLINQIRSAAQSNLSRALAGLSIEPENVRVINSNNTGLEFNERTASLVVVPYDVEKPSITVTVAYKGDETATALPRAWKAATQGLAWVQAAQVLFIDRKEPELPTVRADSAEAVHRTEQISISPNVFRRECMLRAPGGEIFYEDRSMYSDRLKGDHFFQALALATDAAGNLVGTRDEATHLSVQLKVLDPRNEGEHPLQTIHKRIPNGEIELFLAAVRVLDKHQDVERAAKVLGEF